MPSRLFTRLIALCTLIVMAPVAQAAPPVAPAAIAAALADPARSTDNRALDAGRQPAAMLAFSQLRRGDVVADWGAGGGYYSELLARAVGPRGLVYGIGIDAGYKPQVWQPLLDRHDNLRAMFVPAASQVFGANSLDVIFSHLEYHDLYWSSEKYHYPVRDVDAVLRNWFAALRPGGRVIVIDHAASGGDPRETADKYHRIDPARVRADFAKAGFVLAAESTLLQNKDDPHTVGVFDPAVRGHTDRFAMRFVKPR